MSRAKIGSIEIEYAEHGSRSHDPIILIRGLGTQMIEWPDAFIERLVRAELRVIVFDNRDAGLSSKCPEGYAMTDMVNDVVGLMDEVGIDQTHILGMSMGGIIGQNMALDHPGRVISLISVMSTSGAPDLPLPDQEVLGLMMAEPATKADAIEIALKKRALFRGGRFPEDASIAERTVKQVFDRNFDLSGNARQAQAAMADTERFNRLSAIDRPVLVVHGSDDRLIPLAHGIDTARRIPKAEYRLIEGMGHSIPDELSDELAKITTQFTARMRRQ